MVFDQLAFLVGGRQVDYPHVMEHDGRLLIAFSSNKRTVEVLSIRLADLDPLEMSH